MPTSCEIEFENNPLKVIYGGQTLRGTVRLTLTEEKSVRGIYINIHGTAHAQWSIGTGNNRKTHTGNEDYLNEKTYFVGGSSDEVRIGPGTYNYTFQCVLPVNLPTSFEGWCGYIRYTARVVLDIPMWPDTKFEEPFTVLKAINLNADPALRNPVTDEKEELFLPCCLLCCWVSDPMKITARTPVGGYVPGQTINLEISVDNRSDQPISKFIVQLKKEVEYYSNTCHKQKETISITEQETRGCDVNQQEHIRCNIKVPATPPTDFSTSNIIKYKYILRIIASVGCCHPDPALKLPITIGSYPIRDEMESQTSFDMPTQPLITSSRPTNGVILQQPSAPNNYPELPHPSTPFPSADPPSYEEAMHMKGSFKPKYPMFKRSTSYSSGN